MILDILKFTKSKVLRRKIKADGTYEHIHTKLRRWEVTKGLCVILKIASKFD